MTKNEIKSLSDSDVMEIYKEYLKRGLDSNTTLADVYSTFSLKQKKLTERLIESAVNGETLTIDRIDIMTLFTLSDIQIKTLYGFIGLTLDEIEKQDNSVKITVNNDGTVRNWITPKEFAEKNKIKEVTVRAWTRRGNLNSIHIGTGRNALILIPKDAKICHKKGERG